MVSSSSESEEPSKVKVDSLRKAAIIEARAVVGSCWI